MSSDHGWFEYGLIDGTIRWDSLVTLDPAECDPHDPRQIYASPEPRIGHTIRVLSSLLTSRHVYKLRHCDDDDDNNNEGQFDWQTLFSSGSIDFAAVRSCGLSLDKMLTVAYTTLTMKIAQKANRASIQDSIEFQYILPRKMRHLLFSSGIGIWHNLSEILNKGQHMNTETATYFLRSIAMHCVRSLNHRALKTVIMSQRTNNMLATMDCAPTLLHQSPTSAAPTGGPQKARLFVVEDLFSGMRIVSGRHKDDYIGPVDELLLCGVLYARDCTCCITYVCKSGAQVEFAKEILRILMRDLGLDIVNMHTIEKITLRNAKKYNYISERLLAQAAYRSGKTMCPEFMSRNGVRIEPQILHKGAHKLRTDTIKKVLGDAMSRDTYRLTMEFYGQDCPCLQTWTTTTKRKLSGAPWYDRLTAAADTMASSSSRRTSLKHSKTTHT